MRVLLVGLPDERERLRLQLLAEHVDVAAEFVTMSAARGSRVVADAIVVAARDEDDDEAPSEPLTPRELQVLDLLVEGLSNKVIAARLGISDQTVKFHAAAICGKLGAANRTDAVRQAIRRGLVVISHKSRSQVASHRTERQRARAALDLRLVADDLRLCASRMALIPPIENSAMCSARRSRKAASWVSPGTSRFETGFAMATWNCD